MSVCTRQTWPRPQLKGVIMRAESASVVLCGGISASWRMAVTPGERTELVTGGLYGHIRHPIYALSILLMLCSCIVVPTPPMLVVAAIHVALMMVKARNEEAFLSGAHGEAYAAYCAQTGRFIPRLGRRAPGAVRPR